MVFLPLFDRILKFTRGRRTLAAFVTCVLILLLIVLPVTYLGFLMTQQSIALYENIQKNPGTLIDVSARLQEFENRPHVEWVVLQAQKWLGAGALDLQQYLRDAASGISKFLMAKGATLLTGLGGLLFSFFLIFITMFFLMKDGPYLMEIIRASSPLPEAYETEIIRTFRGVSYATFYGSLLTAIVHGFTACLLFLILGLPAPLFWGAMVSLVSLVPLVGAALIWVPWAAYLMIAGAMTRGIVMLVVGMLTAILIENALKPMLIRGKTHMHPLLVFLGVLGGLQAFGFLGVVVGPLAVALFVSFLNFYRQEFHAHLREKGQTPHVKSQAKSRNL
jgi:predicted PurR-regulated permease PerM